MTGADSDYARLVHEIWDQPLIEALSESVAIPSVSPAFESSWREIRNLHRAAAHAAHWLNNAHADCATVLQHGDCSPAVLARIPGTGEVGAHRSVLIYGHLDVQPAGKDWTLTDPFQPRRIGDRLYGRGTGDDKYVPFMTTAITRVMELTGADRPEIIVLLETSEESSSVDFPVYLTQYGHHIGEPDLILCLDAFVPDTERLWLTTSMRGIVVGDLRVRVGDSPLHSGLVGGIVPSSFRIMRQLLDRIEDPISGTYRLRSTPAIPERIAADLERAVTTGTLRPPRLPGLVPGLQPAVLGAHDQLLAQGWSTSIAYVGIDGMPPTSSAPSVIRPETTLRMSIRLPPHLDAAAEATAMQRALTANTPYGAEVSFDIVAAQSGWIGNSNGTSSEHLARAGLVGFNTTPETCCGGATVPPLAMLSAKFPNSEVMMLGVVTPDANPHGPDEYLDITAARALTAALSRLLTDIAQDQPT